MAPPAEPRPAPTTWEWVAPYAGWGLCVAALVLSLAATRLEGPAPRWVPAAFRAAVGTGALGVACLGLLVWSARRRRSRQGLVALGVSGAVWLLLLSAAAWVLPPPPPSDLQESLRAVVARRGEAGDTSFRGTRIVNRFNRLGWPDDEFRDAAARRLVFIGDSFLEVRSTRNLAARVEDHLRADGADVDVLNLSQADTGPTVDYRHRFFELALPRAPERIVVFIYAMNDLLPGYTFQSYRPPGLTVSDEAAATPGLAPPVAAALRALAEAGTRLESRRALLARLPANPDAELAYMVSVSSAPRRAARGPGAAVSAAADALIHQAQRVRGRWRRVGGGCAGFPWLEVADEYQQLFLAPRPERLDRIGRFIAERYCGMSDAAPFIAALRRQPEDVRAFVTAEADMPYYLFPAVAEAAGVPVPRTVGVDPRATAVEYARLLGEMAAAARARGVAFSVVLIPEAAMSDTAFRRFWSGLTSFESLMGTPHLLHRALARALAEAGIDTLDLAAEAGLLDGGYWPLDGHFNEQGNARVAAHLAAWLRR